MKREQFEALVADALDSLPESLHRRMDNLAVEVRGFADAETLRRVNARHPMHLLGIYQGIPYNRRGPWYGNVMPDRILIFQQPIEARCRTEDEVRDLVRSVVIHEIGHYYGLGEDELRRLEAEAGHRASGSPPADNRPDKRKRDG